MLSHSDILAGDMVILLDRALTGQSLTFFGEDGGGRYGASSFHVTHRISAFDVQVTTFSDDVAEVQAELRIFLDGYSSSVSGHAVTDGNLRISLNNLLRAQDIEAAALDWADISKQGSDFICLSINAQKLLSW